MYVLYHLKYCRYLHKICTCTNRFNFVCLVNNFNHVFFFMVCATIKTFCSQRAWLFSIIYDKKKKNFLKTVMKRPDGIYRKQRDTKLQEKFIFLYGDHFSPHNIMFLFFFVQLVFINEIYFI